VELATVLTAIGWEDWRVEESLARLLDEGRLTEVRPDVFRSV
jgi:hypothetical protein